ncbi:hypothetical protein L249_6772 [Ophiocordyceps polyrhachis-furcata BCC 54312]|uniref:Uncharacterized protein n=1 Tax=Ophiocordyceps polyrhachis-furcata BCC 54312 TaxID=1330021 RepID=A0A367LLY6_9HYPO|nr:hypothetical protein L249_6772 [Ophiocordyceps polyrhachis-furcata BCC 54312]
MGMKPVEEKGYPPPSPAQGSRRRLEDESSSGQDKGEGGHRNLFVVVSGIGDVTSLGPAYGPRVSKSLRFTSVLHAKKRGKGSTMDSVEEMLTNNNHPTLSSSAVHDEAIRTDAWL